LAAPGISDISPEGRETLVVTQYCDRMRARLRHSIRCILLILSKGNPAISQLSWTEGAKQVVAFAREDTRRYK
jgi:hypothetical protein